MSSFVVSLSNELKTKQKAEQIKQTKNYSQSVVVVSEEIVETVVENIINNNNNNNNNLSSSSTNGIIVSCSECSDDFF